MGLPRQASNFGIKAELGRKPLFAFICAQAVRYWARLVNMNDNRLLKIAFLSELEVHRCGGNSWVTFILKLFEVMKANHILKSTNRLNDKNEIYKIKTFVMESITKLYYENAFDQITEHNKLRTYKTFKDSYSLENYIKISDIPLSWRKLYCSFRISCHDLEIEKGRYSRPKKSPEERICKLCNICVESELHFIVECNKYSELRDDLYKGISIENSNFMNVCSENKFKYLMTTNDITIVKKVMEFIYLALLKRKQLLRKM